MGTTDNANPYEGLSDTDLQGQIGSVQAELQRRASLPAAERRARMTRELAEIESGDRLAGDEHISASNAATVTRWLNEGKLAHMGYGGRRNRR